MNRIFSARMINNKYRPGLFQGAPLSKAIIFTVIAFHSILEKGNLRGTDLINLNLHSLLTKHEFHRLLLYAITFHSFGEVIFGSILLYQLSRRFEREFGTRGYVSFLCGTHVFATALQMIGLKQKPFACGPYTTIGSLVYLYHTTTPRLHPKLVSFLGFDFSEKSLIFLVCFQLMFNKGYYSMVPLLSGYTAAFLSVSKLSPLSKWRLDIPRPIYDVGLKMGTAIGLSDLSVVPSYLAASSNANNSSHGRRYNLEPRSRGDLNMPRHQSASSNEVPERIPVATPPSDENIEQLLAMGFERAAVVRALIATDNNLEHAANRLLSI